MRVLAGQLILLAMLSAGCGGPPVDLTKGLEIVDASTGWADAGPVNGQNKLVPSITFKLKNVSDQPLVALQVNAVFRRGDDKDEWGSVWAPVTRSDGLQPGATSQPITINLEARLHRNGSARPDAAELAVRRREGGPLREICVPAMGAHRRTSDRAAAHHAMKRPPRSMTETQATSLDRRLGPLDAAAIIVSNVIGGGHSLHTAHHRGQRSPSLAVSRDMAGRRRARLCRGHGVRGAGGVAAARRRRVRLPPRCLRPLAGFLTGWTSFVAGFTGAMAASAVVLVFYLDRFIPGVADRDAVLRGSAALRSADVLAAERWWRSPRLR